MNIDQFNALWTLGFCASLIISFGLGAIKGGQR